MSDLRAPGLAPKAEALLKRAGKMESVERVSLANAGGNNRLYKVETASAIYALKQYFRHSGDTRDRLSSEFSFLAYASQVTGYCVPKPFSKDELEGLALYQFLVGEPLKPTDIGDAEVKAAIEFFTALNNAEVRRTAKNLADASEASFSISEHLRSIEGRIAQLVAAVKIDGADSLGLAEVLKLADLWRQIDGWVRREARGLGLDTEEVLPASARCVSPSDFGYHNAIRIDDGRVCFLDFEYAGWDDPAKTVGDFFSQLAVPVPAKYFDQFASGIAKSFENEAALMQRIRLLRSVYQVKWCCIAMNVFLPVHLARRKFANPNLDEKFLKQTQLTKARKILQSIKETCDGLH